MIKLRQPRVVSFTRDRFDIYWEIEPTTEDVQEYEFYVERSESEAGSWDTIAGPLIDTYFVRDNTPLTISNNRLFFYRIRVRHAPSGREFFSDVIDRDRVPDLIAEEIIRREHLLFQEFAGVKCWVFPRRTFGQRCPQCWDDILGKRNQDQCVTCFNTGFSGGYHRPIEFWGQIDEPEAAEQLTMDDHRQVMYFVLRCPSSPFIKPGDLIIDHLNRRHRVVVVGGTRKGAAPVRQEIRLVEVQKGSIADKVPLRVDEGALLLQPPRNFTNPHNLEAVDGSTEIDSILTRQKY